ncbi:MAG: adenosine kinase [Pirellulaceae bacterium]
MVAIGTRLCSHGHLLGLDHPDAERTMCTHLGVSTSLAETDIHVDHLADSDMVYVEGYLWDVESPRQASVRTMEEAKRAGVRISYTFSDPFLVNRFTDDFRNITREYCDVIFCNAEEIQHFIGDESLEGACRALGEMVELAFVTNGADGCFVVRRGEMAHVPGFSVKAIDTVGAGDAFAGGVLYGLTNGLDDIQAAKWGNFLASRIVTIQGARLDGDFHSKLAEVIG